MFYVIKCYTIPLVEIKNNTTKHKRYRRKLVNSLQFFKKGFSA